MKCLLDTTWIVEHLRGNQEATTKIQELQEEGLAVSIMSVAELYEGVFRSRNPATNEDALKDFLSAVTVLDLDEQTCRVYGEEKTKLLHKGTVIGAFDLLIAATALTHSLVLLTEDRDFERVENLRVTFLSE